MSDLTCPKCQSPMRSYERNGITVDQCSDCRGIFLDRGELERLIDAEGAYYGERRETREDRPEREYDERPSSGGFGGLGGFGGGGHGHGRRRKKESFLSDLFD